MNDSSLIRLDNLKALNIPPAELKKRLGSTKQHWSNVLLGKTSFGEKLARRIEEGLGLPRGAMDDPDLEESIRNNGLSLSATIANMDDDASSGGKIPLKMTYSPANLSDTIVLLGNLLGALDQRSRRMIGMLLGELAESPDDAADVAAKASALATTQRAVVKNKDLNRALTENRDFVETIHPPLGNK